MQTRRSGEIKVFAIGMGCMNLIGVTGKGQEKGYAVKVIRTAHDKGITLRDSAEAYGLLLMKY